MVKINPNKQEKFKEIIREKSEAAKKDWEKSFLQLKKTDQKEMESENTQFLLKTSDDEDSENESELPSDTEDESDYGSAPESAPLLPGLETGFDPPPPPASPSPSPPPAIFFSLPSSLSCQ